MPQLTIYVTKDLERAIRTHNIPLSQTCQAALARRVRLAERRRQGILTPRPDRERETSGSA